MHFEKVLKKKEDADLVMKWRNDPITLSMFYHSEPKAMPDFYQEFIDTYFAETRCPPVFAVKDGARVAFLKFSQYHEYGSSSQYIVDISINVNPAHRQSGIGTKVLREVSELLRKRGVDGVIAEIKENNAASLRAFEKAGYIVIDEQEKKLPSSTRRINIVRMYKVLR